MIQIRLQVVQIRARRALVRLPCLPSLGVRIGTLIDDITIAEAEGRDGGDLSLEPKKSVRNNLGMEN